MKRSLRYLRIAFAATCLISCVLLIVLWVRSYWWSDGVKAFYTPQRMWQLKSFGAGLHLYIGHYSGRESGFRVISVRATPIVSSPPFDWAPLPELRLSIPHWCVLIALGAVSTFPWFGWSKRFSLRTLLVATTLVAAVLGLVVYAVR